MIIYDELYLLNSVLRVAKKPRVLEKSGISQYRLKNLVNLRNFEKKKEVLDRNVCKTEI